MQNEKLFEDTETETDSASVNEGAEDMQAVAEEKPKPEAKPTKKQQFIQRASEKKHRHCLNVIRNFFLWRPVKRAFSDWSPDYMEFLITTFSWPPFSSSGYSLIIPREEIQREVCFTRDP